MIETPDVGTTATTVTTVTTAAAAPSNEEEEDNSAPSEAADVIVVGADHDEQHSHNEDDAERDIKLLQESQGWWFPKTKLYAWVSYRGGSYLLRLLPPLMFLKTNKIEY